MTITSGLGARVRGLFVDSKGPWGTSGGSAGDTEDRPPETGDSAPGNGPDGAPGPWGGPSRRRRSPISGSAGNASLEDILRRGRARFGGNLPGSDRSWVLWALVAVLCLWLLLTSMHSIAPGERGVVTRFGRYSSTLSPGVGLTLPSPIDRVAKVDVASIRSVDLGSEGSSDLMLTGDQNLIDLAYSVRWNIHTPELYLFQLAQPDDTIKEVAESAMRAAISQVTLNEAMGDKRADIEARVQETMQKILDSYHSGIEIQGIAIKQADPPDPVNDAFKKVTAAQQQAQSFINSANAYSLQLRQKAQGDATAFDKVYEQYKLAPDVTRRRMYYETMEQVLSKVDKTIVEAPGVTPYLPLPQVQKSQREPAQ
ncbi:FtsH protease activity modulator HflK [Sphingomonas sp.]|uniref:FtsH protease activity modulator HflK n=1 Tax=Sphingomonas sp. TaxID=28214 RepID=UPI0025F3D9A2|nr:FtsH protease activity modulator HflK [Sphingomonas sp.]MBV9528912.1 FtsH protease activity modulator HflK [Sphingomonas sp.]